MLRFILEKIAFKNVRSYQDEMMEMDFPLHNLTVYTGHVGSGKSTIVKAVSMAMFGDDGGVKGEKLSIDDLVNEKTDKNLEIHLYIASEDLITNESHKYEIHLYHKHAQMKNKLLLLKDTVDISGSTKGDTYKLIESIFIPADVYHNIYYFTQQAKNFFTSLPNSEQKQIFDNILSLKEYDGYYSNGEKAVKLLTQEIEIKRKFLEWSINTISIHEKSILVETESIERQRSEDQARCQSIDSKIRTLQHELERLESELTDINKDELTNRLGSLMVSHASTISTYNANELSMTQELEKKKQDHLLAVDNLMNEYRKKQEARINEAKLIISNKLQKLNGNLSILHDQLNQTQSAIDKIVSDIKQETLVKLNEISGEVQQVQLEIGKLKSLLDSKKLELHKQTIDSLRVKEFDKSALITKVSLLEKTISDLKTLIFDTDTEIRNDKEILSREVSICTKCHQTLLDKAQYEQQVRDNESKVLAIESEIQVHEKDLKACNDRIQLLERFINEQERIYQESVRGMEDEYTQHKEILERKKRLLDQESTNLKATATQKAQDLCAPLKLKRDQVRTDSDALDNEINETRDSEPYEIAKIKKYVVDQYNIELTDLNNKFSESTKDLNKKIENIKVVIRVCTSQHDKDVILLKTQLADIDTKERSIRLQKNTLLEYTTTLSELQNKEYSEDTLNNLNSELMKVREQKLQCENETRDMEQELNILIFWKQAFSDSGIKSMLIDSAIPHMNECVRDELDRIAPGIFTVSFDTLSQTKAGDIRDKFQINILHNLKGTKGHKKLSGGEKRIIDLCCMSALRSLSEKLYGKMFCHIFYDEVLDSLDSDCRQQFCQSARLQSDSNRHVTLITHALTEDVEPDRIFPF